MDKASPKPAGVDKKKKSEKRRDRIIHPIEFKPDQAAAIEKAAAIAGVAFGTWVRSAALEKASKLGHWDPFKEGGPKKES